MPCLALINLGLAILAVSGTRGAMDLSASIFGLGFGTAYPVYVGYVMRDVSGARRCAAFGAILVAFDTGVGTGSTSMGWIIERHGFQAAFGDDAVSAFALPCFLMRTAPSGGGALAAKESRRGRAPLVLHSNSELDLARAGRGRRHAEPR